MNNDSDKQEFNVLLDAMRTKHPFNSSYIGKRNPYTKEEILSATDYDKYIIDYTKDLLLKIQAKQEKETPRKPRETEENSVLNDKEKPARDNTKSSNNHKSTGLFPLVVFILLIISIVTTYSVSENIYGKDGTNGTNTKYKDTQEAGKNVTSNDAQPFYIWPAGQNTENNVTAPTVLPKSGELILIPQSAMLAPLEIIAPKSCNCYVVLVDYKTNKAVMSFFVRSAEKAEVNVPLGTYKFYYATGYKWYGKTDNVLFGKNTVTYTSDDLLEFTFDGKYYNGHSITLYAVQGGNFGTNNIDSSEFPLT